MRLYKVEFNDDSFKRYSYSMKSKQILHQDRSFGESMIVMTSNDLVLKEEDISLFQTFQGGIKSLTYAGELLDRIENVLDQAYGKISVTSTDKPEKIYHVTFMDTVENKKINDRRERILGTNSRPTAKRVDKYKDFDVLQLSAIDDNMVLINGEDIGHFSNKYGGLHYIAYIGELLEKGRVFGCADK